MISALAAITPDFIESFADAFAINIAITLQALMVGLFAGLVIAVLRVRRIILISWAADMVLALFRAVPVFVVMFFLLGVLGTENAMLAGLFGTSEQGLVVLALAPYAGYYSSEQYVDAVRRWRVGDQSSALLVAPNIARMISVLFASSCFGAAIGVPEAMSVILKEIETTEVSNGQFAVLGFGALVFLVVTQVATLLGRFFRALAAVALLPPDSQNADSGILGDARGLRVARLSILSLLLFGVLMLLAYGPGDLSGTLPPRTVVIEAGQAGGTYYKHSQAYAKALKEAGFEVEIRQNPNTTTIADNVEDPESGVDLGFTAQKLDPDKLPNVRSLAVVEFQPLFIFYSTALGEMVTLTNLKQRRIVMPPEQSATASATREILALYGVTEENATFSYQRIDDAVEGLEKGRYDAGFFMLAPNNPLIADLFENPNLNAFSFAEARSVAIKLGYLSTGNIPLGAYDIGNSEPPEPLDVVGGNVNVVARTDLHPSVFYALIDSLLEVHGKATLVSDAGEYPTFTGTALSVHSLSRAYDTSGEPWAFRTFSPVIASLLDEIVLIVLAVILITRVYATFKSSDELLAVFFHAMSGSMLDRLNRKMARGRPFSRIDRWRVLLADAALANESGVGVARSQLDEIKAHLEEHHPEHDESKLGGSGDQPPERGSRPQGDAA